jgi:hypothetical protein
VDVYGSQVYRARRRNKISKVTSPAQSGVSSVGETNRKLRRIEWVLTVNQATSNNLETRPEEITRTDVVLPGGAIAVRAFSFASFPVPQHRALQSSSTKQTFFFNHD